MSEQKSTIPSDLLAGLTVALVAIPQCMAFATIAKLPIESGLYAAAVMSFVGAFLASSAKLNFGPAVTTSSMLLAILTVLAPGGTPESWLRLAGLLALLAGTFTIIAALLNVGQFVRFVSRSVLAGFTAGAAMLIIGTQLGPILGVGATRSATLLGILRQTFGQLGDLSSAAPLLMGLGTIATILILARLGPRFPAGFAAIVIGSLVGWLSQRSGAGLPLEMIGEIQSRFPTIAPPRPGMPWSTDLFAGAVALTLVGIVQTLGIARSLANRSNTTFDAKRDLIALGASNVATAFTMGFPGAGSFARSAVNEGAGAQTRMSGMFAGLMIAVIILFAAPLAGHIPIPAIAGLLVFTAISMVDWREVKDILARGGDDRVVLLVTLACVWVIPIHWAMLIGLFISVALFLRRASELHLREMVGNGHDRFKEHPVDRQTGGSMITMLQVEGPLFFAHADELSENLSHVFQHAPTVTIIRMRRTQQIDFSVIAAMNQVAKTYRKSGGTVIICGLTPALHKVLRDSAFGQTIGPEHLLQTNREVFGSAHQAIGMARQIVENGRPSDRPLFRTSELVETDAGGWRKADADGTEEEESPKRSPVSDQHS